MERMPTARQQAARGGVGCGVARAAAPPLPSLVRPEGVSHPIQFIQPAHLACASYLKNRLVQCTPGHISCGTRTAGTTARRCRNCQLMGTSACRVEVAAWASLRYSSGRLKLALAATSALEGRVRPGIFDMASRVRPGRSHASQHIAGVQGAPRVGARGPPGARLELAGRRRQRVPPASSILPIPWRRPQPHAACASPSSLPCMHAHASEPAPPPARRRTLPWRWCAWCCCAAPPSPRPPSARTSARSE